VNILITGGAGYIGSVTTALLLEAGHTVTVLDNLSQGHRDAIPEGARFIKADITEAATVIKPEDGIEAVIHLAGFIAAGESMSNPEMYWQNNTVGTLKMLDGLRSLGIRKLIFASTAAVYGNPAEIPITEQTAKEPTNTYGMTKLATDMAITSECWAHELAATSVRFFNVAGAYGAYGERHPTETHIIPIVLDTVAGKREKFMIFGDDYPTEDGTCVRDYIHVADLGRAMILALDHLEPGKHTIYNLANGNGFSNKQVVAAVETVTGKKVPVEFGPRRAGDPATLIASSALAHQELGWTPQQPTLEEMISTAWDFYQKVSLMT
jgi:UDP-glucose 4-epimerase